jgi:putative nucleotidyltransferase with HDIG domain
MEEPVFVEPARLAIGMFVILDLSWLKHPFSFNSFVIRSEDELATLRALGLEKIRIDPSRGRGITVPGEVEKPPALPAAVSEAAPEAAPAAVTRTDQELRIEHNRVLRSSIANAEKQAAIAVRSLRQTTRQFLVEPGQAIEQANTLITGIAESLLGNSEVMVHLLGDKGTGDEVYYHSLNVAVLALILGKAMELDSEALQTVGVAAVFHDVGMAELPSRVRLKSENLTEAEEALLRKHCELGARMALRSGLSKAVASAILQHHEHLDGSGYPNRLSGEQIGWVARIIAIVNHYDHLCNPAKAAAVTPYEALSTIFARNRKWFDAAMLAKLVHVLGVYPPGSIVQLSSGDTAIVISVNSARPLRPMLLVYDALIPKAEAIILDLERAPQISISKALRAGSLPPPVNEYLSPRKRVAYFFGDDACADSDEGS